MNLEFVSAGAMLPVPRAAALDVKQIDGTVCVWCRGPADDRIDLGPRISPIAGVLKRWQPRACRACAGRNAARVHQLHIRTCARCSHRDYCPDSRALYGLVLECTGHSISP